LIFSAILPQFINRRAGHVPLQLMALGTVCLAVTFCSDSAWALASSQARTWLRHSPRRLELVGGASGLTDDRAWGRAGGKREEQQVGELCGVRGARFDWNTPTRCESVLCGDSPQVLPLAVQSGEIPEPTVTVPDLRGDPWFGAPRHAVSGPDGLIQLPAGDRDTLVAVATTAHTRAVTIRPRRHGLRADRRCRPTGRGCARHSGIRPLRGGTNVSRDVT